MSTNVALYIKLGAMLRRCMATSREKIIDEIRRLAGEIGRSPGKTLFQRETSIPETHWYGRYWLSWGDALKEAGLSANRVPPKISREELLSTYAMAVRHHGAVPTRAQLRLYAQNNSNFPAQTTFNKTFRDKKRLVAALAEFVRKNDEFGDLVKLLPQPKTSADDDTSAPIGEGFVYLLKSGDYFKVGRSNELERRVKQISVQLPESATLEHAIRTDDPPGIEAYWHRRFAECRANGEWFKLTKADIRAFKRRKFQ